MTTKLKTTAVVPRPTTLVFRRSIRESNSAIQGSCKLQSSGHIATYDDRALRIWTLQKQVKASHHDVSMDSQNSPLVHMSSLDVIDGFLTIHNPAKGALGKCAVMRIFSDQLELLQQIDLKIPSIDKVLLANSQMDMIAIGKDQAIHVLHLDVLLQPQRAKQSGLQEESSLQSDYRSLAMAPAKERYDYNPKPKKVQYIKLVNNQKIECSSAVIRDSLLIDENKLLLLTVANGVYSVMFFSRPSLRPIKTVIVDDGSISSLRKRKALEAKKRRDTELNGGIPPQEKEFCEFAHTATLTLALNGQREPTMIRQFCKQMLLLGYNDGWLQLIQYSEKLLTTDPESTISDSRASLFATTVLAEFHAHYSEVSKEGSEDITTPLLSSRDVPPSSSATETAALTKKRDQSPLRDIFDATKCKTFGSDGLIIEFLTLGSDLRLVHWGIRYIASSLEITKTRTKVTESLDATAPSTSQKKDATSRKKARGKKMSDEEDLNTPPPVYCESLNFDRFRNETTVVEFLGDYILRESSPSDISKKLKADYFLQFARFEVIFLSLSSERPVDIQLMGTFGGQILFWDMVCPHKQLCAWKSKSITEKDSRRLTQNTALQNDLEQMIRCAVRGPDLLTNSSALDGRSVLEFVPMVSYDTLSSETLRTVLLMKGDTVELINAQSGDRIQSLSLQSIVDASHESMLSQSIATSGVLDRDLQLIQLQSQAEMRPSCVHFCSYSQFLLVGYQSGMLGVLNFHDPIYNSKSVKKANYSYLRTNQVHSSPITLIKTFPYCFYPLSNVGISTLNVNDTNYQYWNNDIIVVVLGDASGGLSLWQIYPQRRGKSPLLFHNKQHLGKLFHATLVRVPSMVESNAPEKIKERNVSPAAMLITACDRGFVYAWRVESNLELQLMSYFNALPAKFDSLSMTSLLVLPKMVYRSVWVNQPPEKTLLSNLSVYLQLKGLEMPPQHDDEIEIANLFYEFYCIGGFSDGHLAMWNISSDRENCFDEALINRKDYVSPLVSISHLRTTSSNSSYLEEGFEVDLSSVNRLADIPNSIEKEFTLVNQVASSPIFRRKYSSSPGVEATSYLPVFDEDFIMTTHKNGTSMIFRMRLASHAYQSPLSFAMQSVYKLPADALSVLPLGCPRETKRFGVYQNADVPSVEPTDREFMLISEFETNLFFPRLSIDNTLPLCWAQPFPKFQQYLMIRSLIARGNHRKDELVAKLMSLQRLYAHKHNIPKPSLLPVNLIGIKSSSSLPKIDIRPRKKSGINFTDTIASEAQTPVNRERTDDEIPDPDATTLSEGADDQLLQEELFENPEKAVDLVVESTSVTVPTAPSHLLNDIAGGAEVLEGEDRDPMVEAEEHANELRQSSVLTSTGSSIGSSHRQYVGHMDTMQRIMSSDLYFAKKDRRLLELFIQSADAEESYVSLDNHTVNPDQAVDIVYAWTNEDRADSSLKCYLRGFYQNYVKPSDGTSTGMDQRSIPSKLEIKKESLRELFKLLEIHPSDRLKFIEVAKIAAITASALQQSLSLNKVEIKSSQTNSYKSLRSVKTKVTYNSMGERVVEKIAISDDVMGKPVASTSSFRKVLYAAVEEWRNAHFTLPVTANTAKRPVTAVSPTQIPTATNVAPLSCSTDPKQRLLMNIPMAFRKLIPSSANLQSLCFERKESKWSEEDVHYIDVLRTVRIVRSLFDMRSVRQYELCQSPSVSIGSPESIESMSALVIKYFERQYGEVSLTMGISRQKIASFLEACLQFAEYHPLIKVMKDVLRLDDQSMNSMIDTTLRQMVDSCEQDMINPASLVTDANREVGLWLVTELRNLIVSRNAVVMGSIIDKKYPYEPQNDNAAYSHIVDAESSPAKNLAFEFSELVNLQTANELDNKPVKQANTTKNINKVRWMYVAKADAVSLIDEMLSKRAMFGPYVLMSIFEAIDFLPSVSTPIEPSGNSDSSASLLNMELVLETVYNQFLLHMAEIHLHRESVFGEYCSLNAGISALPRDINSSGSSKLLIMDDVDNSFGPHHQHNLSRIHDLLQVCVSLDPLRTGELHDESFEEIVRNRWSLLTPMCPKQKFIDPADEVAYQPKQFESFEFVRIAHQKMKIKSIEDKISYIDVIALLMTWEEQKQGYERISLPALLESLPTIYRSVEVRFAKRLIQYFTTVTACVDIDNPLWVMGSKAAGNPHAATLLKPHPKHGFSDAALLQSDALADKTMIRSETEVDQSKSLSIPMDGNWRMPGTLPDPAPGLLHVQSALFHLPSEKNPSLFTGTMIVSASTPALTSTLGLSAIPRTTVGGQQQVMTKQEHQRELDALPVPKVLSTSRSMTTVFGETTQSVCLDEERVQSKLKISIARMDGSAFGKEERGHYSPLKKKALESDHISAPTPERSSYSRELRKTTVTTDVSSSIPDPSFKHDEDVRPGAADSQMVFTEESISSFDSNLQPIDFALLDHNLHSHDAQSVQFPHNPPESGVYLPDSQLVSRQQATRTPFLDFSESDVLHLLEPNSLSQDSLESQSLIQSINASLASEEISKRIRQLQTLEKEFSQMYDVEQEDFERRRKEKEALREQIRKEMLWKQRQAMKFYHKALEDRQQRLDKGRDFLRANEELEMQDKKAKELQIQALLAENKAKAMERFNDKQNAEILKLEKEREAKERALMRQEEKLCMAIHVAEREAARQSAELQRKKEQEEFAAMLEKQREIARQREAEEEEASAREAEEASRAASAAARSEPEDDRPEPELEEPELEEPEDEPKEEEDADDDADVDADDEDIAVDNDNEPEVEQFTVDEDEQPVPSPGSSMKLRPPARDKTLSLAEKIMLRVIDDIDNAINAHNSHPRNAHNHDFFMPLTFQEDIQFNSFNNQFNDLDPSRWEELQQKRSFAPKVAKCESVEESETPLAPITNSELREDVNEEQHDDAVDPLDPFHDISHAVKKYRKKQEKLRKMLFKTELVEVPTKDWIPVFRKGYTDWNAFFTNEKRKQEIIDDILHRVEEEHEFKLTKPVAPSVGSQAAGTLKRTASQGAKFFGMPDGSDEDEDGKPNSENDVEGPKSLHTSQELERIPSSLLQALPANLDKDIVPLPFGKVLQNQIVFPHEIKFYQIEVTDPNVILTVELRCRKGQASGFFNYKKLPTTVKYMYKISCTPQNNRFARLAIIPDFGVGKYFFAVYSFDSGAEFDVWAYSSGNRDEDFHQNPSIQKVNEVLMKWDTILKSTDEDLQMHYPRIEAEAKTLTQKRLVEQKRLVGNKHAVINEMREMMRNNSLQSALDAPGMSGQLALAAAHQDHVGDELEFLEDLENIEDFVVKVGRFAMKRSREIVLANQKALQAEQIKRERELHKQLRSGSTPSSPVAAEEQSKVSRDSGSRGDGVSMVESRGSVSSRGSAPSRSISPSSGTIRKKSRPSHSRNASRKSRGQLDIETIENPNQHADLFSAPQLRRLASLNMITPLSRSPSGRFGSPQTQSLTDLVTDSKPGKQTSSAKLRSKSSAELQRVMAEQNEIHQQRYKNFADLPNLPGLSLKLAPSLMEQQQLQQIQQRKNAPLQSQFVGDYSLMSSTSSALFKLPPIDGDAKLNAESSPGLESRSVSRDLRRGASESAFSVKLDSTPSTPAKVKPKVLNPLLFSNPKPIAYSLKLQK